MAWVNDPRNPAVVQALSRKCDLCGAPVGELCVKRGGFVHDLAGRVIHYGRLEKP